MNRARSMAIRSSTIQPDPLSVTHASHYYPQAWFLLVSVMIFGTYVAWDLKVFTLIASLDQSYMASLIIVLVLLASTHCGWHIIHTSQRIQQSQDWLDVSSTDNENKSQYLQQFLAELTSSTSAVASADDAIVEIYADRLRAPAELGWFFVDLAVRLGLLGTIIGFMLIFASLTDINIDGGDDLKNLLIAMSGGMGTALLTTLTGLIGASLLSVQYLLLGREAEHQIGLLLRIRIHIQQDSTSIS